MGSESRLQQRTLDETGHRPWPLPDRPWVQGQTWRDLLFAHWRVPAEELEKAALVALQERHPERVIATNVEYYSAIVLDVAGVSPALAPGMFACSRVAGWSAHILEQKRTGRLFRPSARYVGPAPRSLSTH